MNNKDIFEYDQISQSGFLILNVPLLRTLYPNTKVVIKLKIEKNPLNMMTVIPQFQCTAEHKHSYLIQVLMRVWGITHHFDISLPLPHTYYHLLIPKTMKRIRKMILLFLRPHKTIFGPNVAPLHTMSTYDSGFYVLLIISSDKIFNILFILSYDVNLYAS